MELKMYCGASSNHVHCEQYKFNVGQKLKLFGNENSDEKTTWLDLRNCTGTIDSAALSLLTSLDYLNITGCSLEVSPRAFACLEKLRSLDIRNSEISIAKEMFEGSVLKNLFLEGTILPDTDYLVHLEHLEGLTFENCKVKNMNEKTFHNLNSLEYLAIKKCEIDVLGNIYVNIQQLQNIIIMENKIGIIHHDTFSKLPNLKYLAFFANQTSSKIDYGCSVKLPQLENILFDTDVYKTIDFHSFCNLKTVQIGTYTDVPTDEENELVEKLKSLNLEFQYTFYGTQSVDMSKVQICG